MSFESGSIGVRAYFQPKDWPEDALERFARQAAPPLQQLGTHELHGWVGGRHLLDVPIDEDSGRYGGYLRLTLMQAERRVPPALFRAECMMEELAWMRAEGKAFVDRETRRRIRKMVMDRLQPGMPPTLRGIPMILDENERLLYTGALSDRQHDALVAGVRGALGVSLVPVTFETLVAARIRANVRNWGPVSFTPEGPDAEGGVTPAEDFLTWLWFEIETDGGVFDVPQEGTAGVALDGPLLFTVEGETAAQEAVLRRGAPLSSAEAQTALIGGKKLRRARLTLSAPPRTWTATFDAAQFVFRGLKVTEPEERVDAVSLFQNRMSELGAFYRVMGGLVTRFARQRADADEWPKTRARIHAWTAKRTGRR